MIDSTCLTTHDRKYAPTNLRQLPDASFFEVCTGHKNRTCLQTESIPRPLASINDGYLLPVALYMSSKWNLGDDFDMGEGFCFNKLEINDDFMAIVYNFPEPEVIGGALYTNNITYCCQKVQTFSSGLQLFTII